MVINDEVSQRRGISKPNETVVVKVTRYFSGRNLCAFLASSHGEERQPE